MEQLLNDDNNNKDQNEKKGEDPTESKSSTFKCSTVMKWSFKNNHNAEAFRRSMLPFYLLKDDSGWEHPRYIERSDLSSNLFVKLGDKSSI